MKLKDAMAIIEGSRKFLVHFEWCGDGFLVEDHFPSPRAGEEGYDDKEEAIGAGISFANATKGKTCNFYLVDASTFSPVGGWRQANR